MNNQLTKNFFWLIVISLLANAYGLFSPVLNSNDAYFYAIISKNMLVSGDWVNLIYNGHDWLDKPHFPFWMTAISYKIFGVTPFAYAIAGFVFHVLGLIYTYRLAKMFFGSGVASVAALIYVTSLHLMLSAIDVRAEAFLLGEILPACFYLWRYLQSNRIKHLFLASVFTALALMTKGIFIFVTICFGQLVYLVYTRQLNLYTVLRLALYALLSLVFALPEFICLYLQFDLHPEKLIFGKNGVSGLGWYFWGSQFGRFFNTGPIVNKHGDPFFFIHTFLWSFLPWSVLFILAVYYSWKSKASFLFADRAKLLYLHSGFWLTFVLFSATKFQLDYYTNIIMPFAAIICAFILYNAQIPVWFYRIQTGVNFLLLSINIILLLLIFKLSYSVLLLILPLVIIIYYYKMLKRFTLSDLVVTFACLAISSLFISLIYINANVYPRYNTGYNLNQYLLKNNSVKKIYLLNTDKTLNTLGFYATNLNLVTIDSLSEIKESSNYYLLTDEVAVKDVNKDSDLVLINKYADIPMEKFIPTLISKSAYNKSLRYFSFYKAN